MASVRRQYKGLVMGPFMKSASAALQAGTAPAPSLAAHAVNRLTFGPTPGEVQRVEQMGYEAYLREQLYYWAIDDADCNARLAALGPVTLNESPAQLYDRRNLNSTEAYRPINEVRDATLTRIVHSKRQLFERVVNFWHDHFNIYGWDYIIRSMWSGWDSLLRTHAFGNFRQFLEETARHPCMLYYLDNYISTDGGPNENYTRELFELHTLGAMNYQVDGGFIDQDVYEASRCLTGWSFDTSGSSPNRGQFKYNHDDHDRFIKFVLGSLVAGDQPPLKDGRDVLDKIAFHPGTARHIAWKLAVRFVDDYPPESIVASAAEVFIAYRDAPAQIAAVLEHIFNSDEFKNARMTKLKRAIDWTGSAMRALQMPYTPSGSFHYLFETLGPAMFGWRTPDGLPDTVNYWATSNGVLQRWNWIFRVASGWYESSGMTLPSDGVPPPNVRTPETLAQFWADRVLQRPVSSATATALREFVAEGRGWDSILPDEDFESKNHYVAALACMTPEFMRR